MMIRSLRDNLYLALALALALPALCGCRSPEGRRKKVLSTFSLHLEVPRGPGSGSEAVPIYREHPILINVEKEPFVNETLVKSAKVIDIVGGFALSIQLDRQGAWLLEQYTTANRGRRFAVMSQWMTPPEKKLNEGRWLAAPQIGTAITDGEFTFTPDATRDEAELIALGLNHVAKKTGAEDRW
jgi:hypothetical protein